MFSFFTLYHEKHRYYERVMLHVHIRLCASSHMPQCNDYRASVSHKIVNWPLTWTKFTSMGERLCAVFCLPTFPKFAPVNAP